MFGGMLQFAVVVVMVLVPHFNGAYDVRIGEERFNQLVLMRELPCPMIQIEDLSIPPVVLPQFKCCGGVGHSGVGGDSGDGVGRSGSVVDGDGRSGSVVDGDGRSGSGGGGVALCGACSHRGGGGQCKQLVDRVKGQRWYRGCVCKQPSRSRVTVINPGGPQS
ncbi:hypothetical protein Pcinc_030192 [Petrolisthes cinctipes]|uniref:Uncharacterized protein n=1 Tax=Petrolisthes cinctipes TaxID=88211 RepID=A0AAE1EZA2_PETCI|nr:hypothetical protein Pcinc_030192 [Petrolisthes cinctipes]